MLRDRDNDGNERERLIHAPEEEFDNSAEPSVFGTYYRSNGDTREPQERLYSNMENADNSDSSDDEVKRPLFLSFKANDPASNVSEALREQNNTFTEPVEDTAPLEDPTLSDEQIFDPVASGDQYFDAFPEDDPLASDNSQQNSSSAPKPSIMETMYAKEDYLSSIPKYEVDNSLEDEINASLGDANFSPFQPFAAFRPAEPKEETKPEPVVEEKSAEVPAPVVEEKPAEVPAPVVEEKTAEVSAPAVEEKASEEAAPVVEESPAEQAAPVAEEVPAESSEPVNTAEPVLEASAEKTEQKPVETVSEETSKPDVSESTEKNDADAKSDNSIYAADDIEADAPSAELGATSLMDDSSNSTESIDSSKKDIPVSEASPVISVASIAENTTETEVPSSEKKEETSEDTSSIYDNAPIEQPSIEDNTEEYESIYREADNVVEETPVYAAPQVHPNVSIASTNLVPIDRVYNQPKRPGKTEPEDDNKVVQNHLLFGDEDENEYHQRKLSEMEKIKSEKEAAAAAAAVAAANATEVTVTPTSSNLRPGSSLGNKSESRPEKKTEAHSQTAPKTAERSQAASSGSQRPGASMTRPGTVPGMSTSAQVAKTQHHTYTAASQRGSITPVKQQEHTNEKKRSVLKPLIFVCIGLLCLGALVFCWFHFDLGKSLKSDGKKSEATTYSDTETEESKQTKVITVSDDTSVTTEEPTTTTTEEPTTTTTEEPTTTTTEEPTTTTTEEPTTTTTEEPTTTTTEEPTTTTTEATTTEEPTVPSIAPSEYPVTSFSYKITNAKVSGNNCSFDLKLTNSGSKTSSLNASIKSITIKFNTSVTINEVTCTNFTVVPKEGKKNTFVLYPNSDEAIDKKGSVVASIEGAGSSHISTFTITGVYIEYNKK
ncbi:MAG: hypothetical protein VZR13_01445 [Saccharofermentanaceae bacterium]|nr:hypothetical protein [Saccharofermentanaceae bacterium]